MAALSGAGDSVYRWIFDASIGNPRRTAIFAIGLTIFAIWVRYNEVRAVANIILTQATFALPFGIEVNGKDLSFPVITCVIKGPLSFIIAALMVAVIDGAVFFPFRRHFLRRYPSMQPSEVPRALEELMGVTELLGILKGFPASKSHHHRDGPAYADELRQLTMGQHHYGKPLRILALTGSHLIGDRERSLLWSTLQQADPTLRIEVVLLDPDTEAVDHRVRELHGTVVSPPQRQSYQQRINTTVDLLRELNGANGRVKVYLTDTSPSLGLVIFSDVVFCSTFGPSVGVHEATWVSFSIDRNQISMGRSLEGVFETIKKHSKQIL